MNRSTSPLTSVAWFWWVDLPALVGRAWRSLGDRMTDGIHLMSWPLAGAGAPFVAIAVGLVAARLQDGPTITTSRVLMAAVAAAGTFGFGLGLVVVIGYAVGAYLWVEPVRNFNPTLVERWLGSPGAFLSALLLVWLLAGGIGLVTLAIRADLRARGWELRLGTGPTRIAIVATTGVAAYFATKAMPMLVRPVFVWRGQQPTADAVVPIQQDWWIVVAAAVLAMVARLAVEHRATGPVVVDGVVEVSSRLRSRGSDPFAGMPLPVRRFGTALLIVFLLASLFENVIQAAVTLAVVLAMVLGRDLLARTSWIQAMAAVPLLIRYGLAIVGSWLAIDLILGLRASNGRFRTDSFVVALIAVVTSLALFLVATAPQATPSNPTPDTRSRP